MPEYTANLSERLKEIVGEVEEVNQDTELTLTYTFFGGYEKLEITRNDAGSLSYAGPYHPNGMCEGGGVCVHCGSVMY